MMKDGKYTLRFRVVDKDIFDAIRSGKKKVETRAATEKYRSIKAGDTLVLVCGKEKFEKRVKSAKIYKSITVLVKKYKPNELIPGLKTREELEAAYYNFPSYKEKIARVGLTALELE